MRKLGLLALLLLLLLLLAAASSFGQYFPPSGGGGGGASGGTNPQTSTYQALASDFSNSKTITVASGTFTITLVASGSQPSNGQHMDVMNYGTGIVTIARSGQNINGGTAAITLPAGSATAPTFARIISDGTNYFASVGGAVSGVITFAQGHFASLPSCTTTLNEIYYFDDSIYNQANCLSGATSWTYFHGGRSVIPPTGFTDSITTNSTDTTTSGGNSVVTLSSGIFATEVSYPSGNFTRVMGIRFAGYQVQFGGVGLYIRDSVGGAVRNFQFMTGFNAPGSNNPSLYLAQCSAFYSSCGSNQISSNYFTPGSEIWIKYTDDGSTTRTWSWSVDGFSWVGAVSESRTTGVASPNKLGFLVSAASGSAVTAWLFHYGTN